MATKIDQQSHPFYWIERLYYDGSTILDVSTTSRVTWSDARIGGDFPSWRAYVRAKLDATTSYDCDFQRVFPSCRLSAAGTITKQTGPVFVEERKLEGTPPGWGHLASGPYGMDPAEADRTAREKFIQHYRERRTQFQMGIFAGELMKTIQMLARPAKSLRQAIDTYKGAAKERARRSRHPATTIADTWLEYSYGWKPLISDIEDAARLLTAEPYKVFEVITGRGIDVKERNVSPGGLRSGFIGVQWNQVNTRFVSVKYKGQIGFWNHPPSFPEQLGLSWSNVLPAAWELIPYSFLVDYFSNVGKVIEGASTGTVDLAWGSKTTWNVASTSYEGVAMDYQWLKANTPVNAKSSGYANGGGEACQHSLYSRRKASDVAYGLSDFHFKLPGSGTKWTNIAGLATNAFLGGNNVTALRI